MFISNGPLVRAQGIIGDVLEGNRLAAQAEQFREHGWKCANLNAPLQARVDALKWQIARVRQLALDFKSANFGLKLAAHRIAHLLSWCERNRDSRNFHPLGSGEMICCVSYLQYRSILDAMRSSSASSLNVEAMRRLLAQFGDELDRSLKEHNYTAKSIERSLDQTGLRWKLPEEVPLEPGT